ncbi:MAG: FAD-dependent oxidoreductase [Anaerolineales bacterium]|nr:FAD-dependent oxidoreductase [Anaerolineales bacterium]
MTVSNKQRVAILGAGVTGLVLANELAQNPNMTVEVFERSGRMGGLQRSVHVDGMEFDVGAIIFRRGHGLVVAFPKLLDVLVPTPPRPHALGPAGKMDPFPFSLAGYVRDNGVGETMVSVADMGYSRLRYSKRDTVPAYCKYYLGDHIYRNSGLKYFIERFYDVPDDQLGIEFAHQRLDYLQNIGNFYRVLLNRARPNNNKEGAREVLVRPAAGFDAMFAMIGQWLAEQGVAVRMNTTIEQIGKQGDKFAIRTQVGEEIFDKVFSTAPIPVALRLIGQQPEVALDTMNLLSLFCVADMQHQANVIYNYMPDGLWNRITVFSRYYGKVNGRDYLAVEITTKDTSEPAIARYRQDFIDHVTRVGVARNVECVGTFVTPSAYPIYRHGHSEQVAHEKARLAAFGIETLGRQGNFEYISSSIAANRATQAARAFQSTEP